MRLASSDGVGGISIYRIVSRSEQYLTADFVDNPRVSACCHDGIMVHIIARSQAYTCKHID